jgi:hypothetical protein
VVGARSAADGLSSATHTGYVVSGRMGVRVPMDRRPSSRRGGVFYAAPGHDAWVVGDESCVALDVATK